MTNLTIQDFEGVQVKNVSHVGEKCIIEFHPNYAFEVDSRLVDLEYFTGVFHLRKEGDPVTNTGGA